MAVVAQAGPSTIRVRNIAPRLWRKLRIVSIERNVTVGVLLGEIITEWFEMVYVPPDEQEDDDR